MKLYIRSNNFTDIQMKQAIECIDILSTQGHICSVSQHTSYLLYDDASGHRFEPEDCDLIVSLGGDGALLRAAKLAVKVGKPLIGINSGRLGYLCAMSFDEIETFEDVFKDCEVSRRSMLQLQIDGQEQLALNDIVLSKDDFGKTVDLSLELEEGKKIDVRGDGLIICTPTGSTAYNISAGGPILAYDAKVLAVTPICAHDKNTYPRVVNDDRPIKVYVNHESAGIYADGEYLKDFDDHIVIAKAERYLELYLKK